MPIVNQKGFALFPIILGLIVFLGLVFGAFYYGRSTNPKINLTDQNQIKQAEIISPTATPKVETIPQSSANINLELDSLKKEISSTINSKILIELLSISPINKSLIAYTAYPEDYSKYGLYIYDKITKTSKELWIFNELIAGRGGIYTDNLDLQFSPTGQYLFLNKTGTNTPSLVVLNTNGDIIYQSQTDLGSATWVGDNKLLFITSDTNPPNILEASNKKVTTTLLPPKIYHLKANNSGSLVLAYTPTKTSLNCGYGLDLTLYKLPEGDQLKYIENVLSLGGSDKSAYWISDNTYSYRKVTGCKNQDDYPEKTYSDYISESITQ